MAPGRPTQREQRATQAAKPSVSLEDVQVIERIRAGQTEAYNDLVRKYQDRVFNAAWRICGHLEDARDVTQDAFIKAFENLHAFRQESGFFTWLFRIAVNLALSKRRETGRRRVVSLEDSAGALGEQARELVRQASSQLDNDGGGTGGDSDLHARLLCAIHELDEDFRAVVVLRDIEGMDYESIAEILGVPTGTVKSRLHRARMILSSTLRPGDTRA